MAEISEALYEYLAREISYESLDEDDILTCTIYEGGKRNTYKFTVDTVIAPWTSSFQGYGLVLLDERGRRTDEAVFLCRGTSGAGDIISDLNGDGVGYDQYINNRADVYAWCRSMEYRGYSVSITGNSLGGALAQWFASYVSREGVSLKDVVTFNPAGISKRVDGERFDYVDAESVRHYINSGDIISLAGEWMLPGEYTLFANTEKCVSGDALDYLIDKQHRYVLFFLDSLGSDRRDPQLITLKTGSSDELSDGMFSYLSVKVDNVPALTSVHRQDVVTFSNGETFLFNTEFAEAVMLIAEGSAGHANDYSRRSSLEHMRSDDLYEMIRDITTYDDSERYYISVLDAPVENSFNYYLRGIDLDGNGTRDMYFDFSASRFIRKDVNVSVSAKVSKYSCTVKWPKLASASAGYEVMLNSEITQVKSTSVTFRNLAVGDYVCKVREAFTGEWSSDVLFTVKDVTPPVLKIYASVTGYDARITFNGSDNTAIVRYTVKCGGTEFETTDDSGVLLEDLAPGKYTCEVRAYDAASLASKTAKAKITVKDVTPPEKAILNAVATSYRRDCKTLLAWNASNDNLGVVNYLVAIDDAKAKKVSAKKLELLTGKLSVGTHSFKVAALDKAGNISEWSDYGMFEVADVASPSKPSLKLFKQDSEISLAWNLPKDNVGVTAFSLDVFKDGIAFGETLDFSSDVRSKTFRRLSDGSYRFELAAFDGAGNESRRAISKTVIASIV